MLIKIPAIRRCLLRWTWATIALDTPVDRHRRIPRSASICAICGRVSLCYQPANRHEREATWSEASPQGRWRPYGYDQLAQRDKLSLDIFWLKDDSLEDSANLEDPDVIAAEIVEDLRAALEEFELILGDLGS